MSCGAAVLQSLLCLQLGVDIETAHAAGDIGNLSAFHVHVVRIGELIVSQIRKLKNVLTFSYVRT